MSVVYAEYDSRSAKLRRTVKLVEQSVITSATLTPPFSPPPPLPPPPSVSCTNASHVFVSAGVIGRKFAACRYTSNRECVRTAFICYSTNNSADLGRNVEGEATNLSMNFEARFSMEIGTRIY